MEAALSRALSAIDAAIADRSKAEAGCRGCVPCLFQDCGQRKGACGKLECTNTSKPGLKTVTLSSDDDNDDNFIASSETTQLEPSCEVISHAQQEADEGERSWLLSQACGFYKFRCSPAQLNKDSCIRIMGESCSARVLQCSLLNTMQNLEPATQTTTQAVCGQRLSVMQNLTQPRSRIMGGSPAPPGSWPWLVNLRLDGALMCGGVLVDSSWVVTAAHCFVGSRSESYWTAVVGEFDLTKTDPDEQVMKVNRIITHPKFNPKTFNNDIALVELSSPVILSEWVTPVCLPSDLDPPGGTPCLVAGWGSLYEDGPSADVVMEAKVPLMSQTTCRSALGKELLTNTMFCAGYLSGGIDSCQGDSGGPLIFQDRLSGRFQLFGITSWGDGCGEKGKPGVYTRVTAFSDWVLTEIQKSFGSREPTCPELLKTTELSEEQQMSEFCHFYTQTCSSATDPSACQRLAQEKCQSRFKKCQLRSFLQTLLDLLQRADDYIRDKVDLNFLTQTLPQLVENVYSSTHIKRQRRNAPTTEQVGLPAIFQQVGPLVDDWESYLRGIAEDLDQLRELKNSEQLSQEEQLFTPDDEKEESPTHQLDGALRSSIAFLHSKLESLRFPVIPELDHQLFQRDFTTGKPQDNSAHSEEPVLSPDIWTALILKALRGNTTGSVTGDPVMTASLEDTYTHTQPLKLSTMDHAEALLEKSSLSTPMPLLPQSLFKKLLQRKRRALYKRRIRRANDKVCSGVTESAQLVSTTKEMYNWILAVPPNNLNMIFQEVLVDLNSKNERGLYQSRIKATVGGRPLTFYSLVGLENEAFYRSMPRIIAVAIDSLKT
ncbi:serine protease 56 [Xyrauchen texanus]|uniref:serine protease 56 n=1 Tax=Xyrauchen texanus TaxID=154827 RepID=UPI002241AF0F|nr:serine protease 56 [Xyrauchen texanus]